jgi:hypothetical protein
VKDRLRIAVSVPYLFSVRDFLFTPVWEEMEKRDDAHFLLLCRRTYVQRLIESRNCSHITAAVFPPPRAEQLSWLRRVFRRDILARLWVRAFRCLDRAYVMDSLGYRFGAVNDLAHYRVRRNKSRAERKRFQVFPEYRRGEWAGVPFPKSRALFRLLYGLRHGPANRVAQRDVRFLAGLDLDLFVLGRLHHELSAYWARGLRRAGIPFLGIVSSWDHPTTKGPTPRGASGYVVASKRMADEMAGLHGIDPRKIQQIGKVQMDLYTDETVFQPREAFLGELGVPADHQLVTFGPNTTGLKEHEVSIAARMAGDFARGRYGKATLLIRTHPQDANWQRDFLALAKPPHVICMNACGFGEQSADPLVHGRDDLVFLANLMRHSDVVIQSRGSLALDAIAQDTPVISLAFDGDLAREPADSFLMEYAYEHFKPLVTAQGTWMAGSYAALDQAIRDYLRDPSIHLEGRARIRDEHIGPLDGDASRRLVDHLVASARKARDGSIPPGDWGYTGLGDVDWSSRQTCSVEDYVQR